MILVDTNIFIDILQETPSAKDFITILEAADPNEKFGYSVITWFELCARPQQKESSRHLLRGFESIPLTLSIAELAADIFAAHLTGNRRHIPDAFIAATAMTLDAPLWTNNKSEFRRIPRLNLFSA